MKNLLLTTGEAVIIDDEDFERVSRYNWYNSHGYAFCTSRKMKISLHRFILNAKKGEFVDHKDFNTFNNMKSNIRICTWAQNSQNRAKVNKNTSSKYKGVCWSRHFKRWMAGIKHNGKYYAKKFIHEINAAIWYDKIAKKLYGEFAYLNFKDGYKGEIPEERKFSSKYIGVIWSKEKCKWRSEIRKDKKAYSLGYFTNEKEAYLSYRKKELELYGKERRKNSE